MWRGGRQCATQVDRQQKSRDHGRNAFGELTGDKVTALRRAIFKALKVMLKVQWRTLSVYGGLK